MMNGPWQAGTLNHKVLSASYGGELVGLIN